MLRSLAVILLAGVLPSSLTAGPGPLLPRPQEIHYGAGRISIRGLTIRLPAGAGPDDVGAAKALSACLADHSRTAVAVSAGGTDQRAIVLKRTGSVGALPLPGEQLGPDSREAYRLTLTQGGAELRAVSTAGLFYGVQTVCQLADGAGDSATLPEVEIHDWPSFAYRGTMVDMSHGPLPTEGEIERQLDFMARWKANQYYFYSEASIQLDGYPLLNPAGRFGQDEIRRIVAYGRERHIDVIPCLELYGHLHDLFRVEKYSSLADLPHGTEFDPRNPGVMPLLTDWARQFGRLFPSPFVHIGFDETFQIEMAAKEAGGAANPATLFIRQLGDVARLFQQQGKTVMAWGDIIVKFPEAMQQLPPGLIAIAWDYDPGPPEHFEPRLGPLAAHHIPHLVASGVTSWNQISPDFTRSFENIDDFLAVGRKSHALGLMNTIWTDDGETLMRTAWPGIAYGAAAAWQSAAIDRQEFFKTYATLAYPAAAAPEVASALDDLARAEATIQKALDDDSMLHFWDNPFAPATLKKCTENQEALHQARLLAEDAEERLGRARSLGADAESMNSFLVSSRMLDYAGQKFQTGTELVAMWQRLGPKRPQDQVWWNEWDSQVTYQDHSRIVDLMDASTELREEYRQEWLAEYTPYRLASALGRWDAEYEFWRQLQVRLTRFSNSSKEGDPLPPLESFAPSQ
ncbi:MAG TPA: glycoside hydrolase family 20 zincin-like fold domain-containing protein [Terriglobia bacterium]|nr:glycoside hydrolase family 20 zincin-like fold domain-containing protein [Terriglobia bacterium]